jgi:hypothetical protein
LRKTRNKITALRIKPLPQSMTGESGTGEARTTQSG